MGGVMKKFMSHSEAETEEPKSKVARLSSPRLETKQESTMDVLLLKAAAEQEDGNDPYIKVLRAAELNGSCLNVLSFKFIHEEELTSQLCQAERYSGIILTSRRAVEAAARVTSRLPDWTADHAEKWRSKPAYVVGKSTAAVAKAAGFSPRGEESGNADLLVQLILEEVKTRDRPLLFPCGNLRKETIPKTLTSQGIQFESITVYETTTDPELGANLTKLISEKGRPKYVVFFSPSGVDSIAGHLSTVCDDISEIKFVAIGPSTREALQSHGLPMAAMASKPTPERLVEAIQSTV